MIIRQQRSLQIYVPFICFHVIEMREMRAEKQDFKATQPQIEIAPCFRCLIFLSSQAQAEAISLCLLQQILLFGVALCINNTFKMNTKMKGRKERQYIKYFPQAHSREKQRTTKHCMTHQRMHLVLSIIMSVCTIQFTPSQGEFYLKKLKLIQS